MSKERWFIFAMTMFIVSMNYLQSDDYKFFFIYFVFFIISIFKASNSQDEE